MSGRAKSCRPPTTPDARCVLAKTLHGPCKYARGLRILRDVPPSKCLIVLVRDGAPGRS